MAGVLLKCWCAAYINPLRQGRDRLGQGRHSLSCISPSIIYHHLFICLCLFTSLVSIHLRPASHPPSQLPSCSLLHLCNILLSVTATFNLQCVYMHLCCQSPYAVSLSLRSYLSRWGVYVTVCLSFSLCVSEPRDLVLLMDGFWVQLSFGHGALTETLEGLSGTRHWGEIERALKRLWIPVPSPLLTGSSSLLAPSQRLRWMVRIVGMDGSQLERQLWVATLVKQHQQGINRMMEELGWQYEHERAYVWVLLHVCVYLYPYGCRVGGVNQKRCDYCRSTAEGRADYVWKSLHTCVSIMGVWSVRESKCETAHIGPCCFSKLWLSMASASVVPPSQPACCNPPCLAPGSGYGSARPTWALGGTQYSLHRPVLLIAVSEAILYHPLTGLAEVLFSLSRAVCTANRWHLNYGWCRPAEPELTVLLMATLQMAFHFWLINTIKTQLVHTRWRPVTLLWPDTVSSKRAWILFISRIFL